MTTTPSDFSAARHQPSSTPRGTHRSHAVVVQVGHGRTELAEVAARQTDSPRNRMIHLTPAGRGTTVRWAELAARLSYVDQAHLVRDFTAAVGLSPRRYAALNRSARRK